MKWCYTHMGLGDHLITNGLIRELVKRYGEVTTFAKPHNADSVRFMYRDIPVTVVEADDWKANIIIGHEKPDDVIIVGHWKRDHSVGFDQAFYRAALVPFECRWDSFKVERIPSLELVDTNPDPYTFVHDDASRGMGIHETNLPSGRKARPDKALTPNIFQWMTVLEKAKEIHCIESAFAFLVDSFAWDKPLVLHRYARQYPSNERPTYRQNWKVLE